jgi:hypothetical protein
MAELEFGPESGPEPGLESRLASRLHEALDEAGERTPPSPDLFARVAGSIADDRARRRRLRTVALVWAAGIAVGSALILGLTPRDEEGMHMPWWILEVGADVLLVGIAVWLGPFIKRFGRAYAADVFHDNPQTGKSYIVLTDIVYYLIFTAYILFTVRLQPPAPYVTDATAGQVEDLAARIGGILLVIGVLHGLNLLVMPVLGRLFSLNRRLPPHG